MLFSLTFGGPIQAAGITTRIPSYAGTPGEKIGKGDERRLS